MDLSCNQLQDNFEDTKGTIGNIYGHVFIWQIKRYLNLFPIHIEFGFVVHEQFTLHLENIRNTKEIYVIQYSYSLCNGLKMQTIYIILQCEL